MSEFKMSQDARQMSRAERRAAGELGFSALAIALDVAAITLAALATGVVYHLARFDVVGVTQTYLSVGAFLALLYVLPHVFRNEYQAQSYLQKKRGPRRAFLIWNYAFLCLAAIGFLTQTTETFSRGWVLMFYGVGFVAALAAHFATLHVVRRAVSIGILSPRRVMLIGDDRAIADVETALSGLEQTFLVVAVRSIPTDVPGAAAGLDQRAEQMAAAVGEARAKDVDDVVILADWRRQGLIDDLVQAFASVPIGLHLGAPEFLSKFPDPHLVRFGTSTAFALAPPPLAPAQAAAKRAFDVAVSGLALLVAAPLFAAIAAAIKLDSDGPVFFRQRRTGFNTREFRIWKFRTMSTLDDGATITQAAKDDVRVTRVGRILRKLNLDELPQLMNVLAGDMSLVGPRPHAVAHDRHYEKRIGAYVRRLKVRPGITGWAQIHGFRGATHTDAAMAARVRHDLHYVENWSLGLDIYIIAMTVLSPKAYRNAV